MSRSLTKMVRAVETAARLRSAGSSWSQIAEELRRTPETVRQWPRRYPDVWARAAGETRRDILLGAHGEALSTLRTMLRSEDDRTRGDAARELLRRTAESLPADVPAVSSPFHALADYLGGLTDEQRRQMLDRELAQARQRASDEVSGPHVA